MALDFRCTPPFKIRSAGFSESVGVDELSCPGLLLREDIFLPVSEFGGDRGRDSGAALGEDATGVDPGECSPLVSSPFCLELPASLWC